jgi:restriction system protein
VTEPSIPSYRDLLYPTLQALDALNGSATKNEVDSEVISALGLTDAQLAVEYPPEATARGSKVVHRLAFARSSLKLFDAADNSTRGVWSLTPVGRRFLADGEAATRQADSDMRRRLHELRLQRQRGEEAGRVEGEGGEVEGAGDEDDGATLPGWRGELLATLLAMPPHAFESLCGRLLREVGFAKIEVTSRSHDGGIDGSGLLEVTVVSFRSTSSASVTPEQSGRRRFGIFEGQWSVEATKGCSSRRGRLRPQHEQKRSGPALRPSISSTAIGSLICGRSIRSESVWSWLKA